MVKKKVSLRVEDLKIYYCMKRGECRAVESISFHIQKGESVGLVGESGCGKSTVAFSILRMLPFPGEIVGGNIYLDDEDLGTLSEEEMRNYRWTKIAMVFQGAMNALNPIIRVKEQITEAIRQHNPEISKKEALATARELFTLVGMDPNRINNYPFEFSGGMKQRAMIVMALACNPKFLIADEPTTALDVTVQAQIMELLRKLVNELGITLMLITHDLSVVAETCKKVIIMYAGKIVESGAVQEIFALPLHPYSQGLIASIPSIEKSSNQSLASIPGQPPNLLEPPTGCRFHPRCQYSQEICVTDDPPVKEVTQDHFVACHLSSGLIISENYNNVIRKDIYD
ncbi:MAG: ABC transporter ATP-binding protein [Candidatus Hodarchaeales archaeon]|jgi:peptide/nickel transport system ATP-binding protein